MASVDSKISTLFYFVTPSVLRCSKTRTTCTEQFHRLTVNSAKTMFE